MPVPSLISSGTQAATAASVATPSTLTPGLPGTRQNGDVLFCLTSCRSATPTVSVSGWTQHFSVTGTFGRIALFSRVVDGTEAAPSVVWTGLTTGNSGTPALAIVSCFRNLKVVAGDPVIQIQGNVANQVASSTQATWGGGFGGTAKNQSLRFALVTRQDDAGTWTPQFIGGVSWTANNHATTTSGADMSQHWDYFVMPTGGSIGGGGYDIAGGASAGSSGINIAIEAAPITQAVGTANETDTAQPITPAKRVTVGTAVETDTARPITRGVNPHPVGTATEADTARQITPAKARPVGIAAESDSARPIPPAKARQVGTSVESNQAEPITPAKARAVGTATETDEAQPIGVLQSGGAQTIPVGTATETDEARPITVATTPEPEPTPEPPPPGPTGLGVPVGPTRKRVEPRLVSAVDVLRFSDGVATRARATATGSMLALRSESDRRRRPARLLDQRTSALALRDLSARTIVKRDPETEEALREEDEIVLLALVN